MRNKLFLLIAACAFSGSLYAADFSTMDTNGDGKITKDEFHGTVSDLGTFSDYDLNGDDWLSDDEFSETSFDSGVYDDWDANNDGQIDENEFYDGTFSYYDENEDGHWNSGEWDDAGEDGLWDM